MDDINDLLVWAHAAENAQYPTSILITSRGIIVQATRKIPNSQWSDYHEFMVTWRELVGGRGIACDPVIAAIKVVNSALQGRHREAGRHG